MSAACQQSCFNFLDGVTRTQQACSPAWPRRWCLGKLVSTEASHCTSRHTVFMVKYLCYVNTDVNRDQILPGVLNGFLSSQWITCMSTFLLYKMLLLSIVSIGGPWKITQVCEITDKHCCVELEIELKGLTTLPVSRFIVIIPRRKGFSYCLFCWCRFGIPKTWENVTQEKVRHAGNSYSWIVPNFVCLAIIQTAKRSASTCDIAHMLKCELQYTHTNTQTCDCSITICDTVLLLRQPLACG